MCFNLKKCCGFDLKTGALIVAFLDLVFGIQTALQQLYKPYPTGVLEIVLKVTPIFVILIAILLIIGVKKVRNSFLRKESVLSFYQYRKTLDIFNFGSSRKSVI